TMARKATSKGKKAGSKSPKSAVAKTGSTAAGGSTDMGDAFVKLLQSPLVAELVAVAATAALASLAEQGFSHRGGGGGSIGERAGAEPSRSRRGRGFGPLRRASRHCV